MTPTPHFSLRVSKAPVLEWVISVSKKVSKQAVVRNQVKRRVRPILKSFSQEVPPASYLIIAKAGASEVKGEDLKAELATLLKKG